jgi:hypothetical protein
VKRHKGGFSNFSSSARKVHPMNVVAPLDRGGIRL